MVAESLASIIYGLKKVTTMVMTRVKGETQGKRRKRQQVSLLEVTSRDVVRIK